MICTTIYVVCILIYIDAIRRYICILIYIISYYIRNSCTYYIQKSSTNLVSTGSSVGV